MMALGKTNLEKMRLEKTSRDLPGHGVPGLDLPQGTLDLLILRTLLPGAQHGWAISERVQQVSENALRIQQGSLYPALYRLEHQGAITSDWGESENNRRAKFYRLTAAGRNQLEAETAKWRQMADLMGTILSVSAEPA